MQKKINKKLDGTDTRRTKSTDFQVWNWFFEIYLEFLRAFSIHVIVIQSEQKSTTMADEEDQNDNYEQKVRGMHFYSELCKLRFVI